MHVNIPESKPLLSSCPRPLPLLFSSSPPSPPSRSARLWEVAHRLPKEVGQVLEAHEPPEHPNVMAAVEQMEGGEVGGEDAGEAGAQEEYAQGAQGQGEEGQAGVEYGQAGAEGVQYTILGRVTARRHTRLRRLRSRTRRPLHHAALASPRASPAGRPPAQPSLASAAAGTTATGPGTRRGRATPPRPRRCTRRRSSSTASH